MLKGMDNRSTRKLTAKEGSDEQTETKVAFEEKTYEDPKAVDSSTRVNVLKGPLKPISFCSVFCVYHRCFNLYASSYHELSRPMRVFSFSIQLMVLLNMVGVFTYVFDLTHSAIDSLIAFAIGFVVVRAVNWILNILLTTATTKRGACFVATLIGTILFYLACHYGPVHVTMVMSDADFLAWTIAFFVAYLLDVILWEIIVSLWQYSAVKKLRAQSAPGCG